MDRLKVFCAPAFHARIRSAVSSGADAYAAELWSSSGLTNSIADRRMKEAIIMALTARY